MTSKQLSEWSICVFVMLQSILVDSTQLYSDPCPIVFGYAYRCVKPQNCNNPQSIYRCGPNGIGICCPVISRHSSPNCGLFRSPAKDVDGLGFPSKRMLDGFGEIQDNSDVSSTSQSSDNNGEPTISLSSLTEFNSSPIEDTGIGNTEFLFFTNFGDKTFKTASLDDGEEDSTQTLVRRGIFYGNDKTESTEMISDGSKISVSILDLKPVSNHDASVPLDSRTVSFSDKTTSENVMETIYSGSDVETTNSLSGIENKDISTDDITSGSGSDTENSDISTDDITSGSGSDTENIDISTDDITAASGSDSGFTLVLDSIHKKYNDNGTSRVRRQTENVPSIAPETATKLRENMDSKESEESEESEESSTNEKSQTRYQPRKSNPQHIVGGRREVTPWPWIAAIYLKSDGRFICAGTLIDRQHILSAAHCFQIKKFKNPPKMTVVIGHLHRLDMSFRNSSENVVYHHVASLTVHEEFNLTCFCSDIAVLRLVLPLGPEYTPACMNDREPSGAGEKVTVLGWGDLEYIPRGSNATRGSYFLQRVDGLMILPGDECSKIFAKIMKKAMPSGFKDYYICAGVTDGTKDACVGDSGGPLMFEDYDGYWSVIGVVSFGFKCATPGIPGAYSKISYYMPWISKILQSR